MFKIYGKEDKLIGFLDHWSLRFLGSRITDWLEQRNQIFTVGTNSPNIEKYKYINNYLNLSNEKLENTIRDFHTIYDASGIGINSDKYSFNSYLKKNSIWPSRLAKACVKTNTNLVWFSTIHCEKYDKNTNSNFDKYSLSKFLGEQIIKTIPEWEKNILILRLGNIIGAPESFIEANQIYLLWILLQV